MTAPAMKCERCGRILDRFEGGAYIGVKRIYLCHPDDETLPDCYSLWTRGSQAANRTLEAGWWNRSHADPRPMGASPVPHHQPTTGQ